MKTALILASVVALAACGGGGKKSDDPMTNTGGTTETGSPPGDIYGGAEYGGYHKTPELTAFHDAIAGKTTAADACPASAALHDAAVAIAAAAPPAGTSADMWPGEANELVGISEDFITNCAGADAGATQYDVDSLHRSFQRLLKQLPAS